MAWTASGLYVATWLDVNDATQETIDLTATTHKVALYTNSLTPNFSTDAAYSATNEATGTGYTAGGLVLTGLSPTYTESPAGFAKYTHSALVWTITTSLTAHGAIWYADAQTTPVADPLIVGLNFAADFTATNGTFTVTPAANGVFRIQFA